jgi:choline kinase/phosphohistidine swiveling domain-containing protein
MKEQHYRVVILGAGKGRGAIPSAIVQVDEQSRVLDWLLEAFSALPSTDVAFVSGYEAGAVMDQYPDIQFVFNPAWETTGPARSLGLGLGTAPHDTFVSYSDVVFLADTVRQLQATQADLVLAVDRTWRVRYGNRSAVDLDGAEKVACKGSRVTDIGKHLADGEAAAEFAGLMKMSAPAAARVADILRRRTLVREAGLPELIRVLIREGVVVEAIDIAGAWAELNAPQDLARFVLGTKAESLTRLRPLVRQGVIEKLLSFTHSRWDADRAGILAAIVEMFGETLVIARSSAVCEDTWHDSAAGAYVSVADLPTSDSQRLGEGIDEVFASYGDYNPQNQVLVQEMLRDVTISGVVLTRSSTDSAPYYVINFDDTSRQTNTVTAGIGDSVRTVFLHRGAELPDGLPGELHRLMDVVYELERLVGHDSLDIEFAFTQDGRAHTLQVRPIPLGHLGDKTDDARVARGIESAQRFFLELNQPTPFVLGKATQLSVMSDWNPAEMIGIKPRRLAFSLYRHLITDEVWATQRAEYGYRDVRPCNLIVDVVGHPYVDVRVDFNSFVPADLPDELAERLVDHYLDRLSRHPELHDKVEFDVLFTCLTFDFAARSEQLARAGFTPQDIGRLRDGLLKITRNGMRRIAHDEADLGRLERRFAQIRAANVGQLEKAHLFLQDAKRYGILPFAHLARGAFVAVSLLRSLKAVELITIEQMEAFLASVRSTSNDIQDDAYAVKIGALEFEVFAERYGHLRPGTYEITSPCYGSAAEKYLRPMVERAEDRPQASADVWDAATRERIASALRSMGFDPDVAAFTDFLRRAIAMREHGKFLFTRNLSAALEEIAEFGASCGVSRRELAHIHVDDLLALRGAHAEMPANALKALSAAGQEGFLVTRALCLPGQVFASTDLRCFETAKSQPNFISRKRVQAAVVALGAETSPDVDLSGKIVAIPNADPGFDWIFTHDVVGLITMYGGANSHMAIRAAQLELPAAIGVGTGLFDKVSSAAIVDLDCGSHRVEALRHVEARTVAAGSLG